MGSSLQGIYNAERALLLNQAALNVISNNVSNINTTGYTKETLNIKENSFLPSQNTPSTSTAGLDGATIASITRNRDTYLDTMYRNANSSQAYYQELNTNGTSIENITNELSNSGINSALSKFYNAASNLSQNPTDKSIRTAFVQAAQTVASQFNSTSNSLTDLRTGLIGDINNSSSIQSSKLAITCTSLNNDLKQLAQINNSLTLASTNGTQDNGLLDQRDKLLDDISQYVPITTTFNSNGAATVSTGNITLVSGIQQSASLKLIASSDANNPTTIQIIDPNSNIITSNANSLMGNGQIGAILQVAGYNPTSSNLSVGGFLNTLNTMANAFAKSVNDLQTYSVTDSSGNVTQAVALNSTGTALAPPATNATTGVVTTPNNDVFVITDGTNLTNADYSAGTLTAANIKVNSSVLNNPYEIAAATITYPYATGAISSQLTGTGDGSNALAISELGSTGLTNLGNATAQDYLSAAVTTVGSQLSSYSTGYNTANALTTQTETTRQSTSGVNLDEELTHLTQFQRTYEASAKVMTAINAALQTIIGMVS